MGKLEEVFRRANKELERLLLVLKEMKDAPKEVVVKEIASASKESMRYGVLNNEILKTLVEVAKKLGFKVSASYFLTVNKEAERK